ncbi:MAG: type II secretion system protein [Limisphaerales bacterium]
MRQQRKLSAFTLIEMLVVIGIIGILAAMIIGVAVRVAEAKKIKRVDVEKHRLIAVIEAYQAQMGSFPPDNGMMVRDGNPDRPYAATNQLFYELTSCTYTAGVYTTYNGNSFDTNDYKAAFARDGVLNSIEPKRFYNPPPKSGDFITMPIPNAKTNMNFLVVPVDFQGNSTNLWRYDSSSTNRHNSESFDLWAVFTVGSKTITNGNW